MALEYTVRNMDFSEYDENPMYHFVKEDRNHTRYYTASRCRKCGGTGYLSGYEHVQGGVCFRCGGSGHENSYTITVRTFEYAEKLRLARLEKARKGAAARNAKYLKSLGFNEAGETWLAMGDTYKMKEDLKAAGARYNDTFGWHFDHEPEKFDTVKINTEDTPNYEDLDREEYQAAMFYYGYDGTLILREEYHTKMYVEKIREEYRLAHLDPNGWYGKLNDKFSINVTLTRIGSFDTQWGTTRVYTFETEDGKQLVWKTGSWWNAEVGKSFKLSGTIKAHTEYRGVCQTEVTRCKAIAA